MANKNMGQEIKKWLRNFFFSFIWLVPLLLIFDFASKLIFEKILVNEGKSIEVIKDFFYFTLRYNKDIAWSIPLFNSQMWAYAIVSAIGATLMVSYLIWKRKTATFWTKICLYVMLAGCLGNFIDRAFYGQRGVIDFIHFYIFDYDFPVFNIADSCLVLGVIGLAIVMFINDYKLEKIKRQKNVTKEDSPSIEEVETKDE